MKLSPTMQSALGYALLNGRQLVRYPGGFWSKPGLEPTSPGFSWSNGNTWFSLATIKALSNRGYLVLHARGFGFWVLAEVIK